jgi:threonine dehydrogenase-like Zn-dependent dehydrogenase
VTDHKPRALDQPRVKVTVFVNGVAADPSRTTTVQQGDRVHVRVNAPSKRTYCYCPKCAGGLPPLSQTIRDIKAIRGRKFK